MAKLENCIHIFCYDCIKDWAAVTNTCPLCKATFSTMTKHSEDGV